MGKVTKVSSDTNPFEQWASQKKDEVATSTDTATVEGGNPFEQWAQIPKKKSGGIESSHSQSQSEEKPIPMATALPPNLSGGTTNNPIIRPIVFLDAREINQAGRNYADANLTGEDVGILADTEFGKAKGFNNIPESARDIYAQSYNISRKNDVANSILQVVNNYYPQIKNGLAQDGKDPNTFLNNFKSGDANAIKDFKQKTISQLQLQIKNLQQPLVNAYRSATMPDVAVASEVGYASQNDAQIQALQGQIANVESTLNKYALQSITDKYLKQANNNPVFVDFVSLGKDYHDYLGDKYTVEQENLASKSNKLEGEIARQNLSYRNESTGLNAVIDYNKIKAANSITKGLPSNDKVSIENADKDLLSNEALQKSSDDILLRYPSVGVNFASRYLGDVIAEDKNFFVPYVSANRVKEGIAKIQKDTPEIYSKYKTYFEYLAAHPTEVTEGGLSASFAKGMEGIGFDLASLFMNKEDKAAAEIARQNQANLQDTKFAQKNRIIYDNEGKAFREINDETYSPFNFNTSVSVIGKGIPALLQWGALQEATGGTAGLLGAGNKAKDVIGLVGSTYMMDYVKNKSYADRLIDDNSTSGEFKRNIVANLLTLSTAAAMKVLNPADLVFQRSLTTSLGKDAVDYINKEGVEGLANQNKLLNWFKESATPRIVALSKSTGQNLYKGVEGGAAMVINNQFRDLVTAMANPDAQLTTGEENLHTFVETALTVIATGLPSMVKNGFTSSYKDMMYHAGLFPQEYIQKVNESLSEGKIDQKTVNETISVIKTLGEEVSKVGFEKNEKGLPTIQRQKRDLAIANFRERAAQMLKEKGNSEVDPNKVSSEVKEEKKNIVAQNYTEPIEESAAFKELSTLNPEIKQFSDIDPKEDYQFYNDKGEIKTFNGADLINEFQTRKDLNEPMIDKSAPSIESAVIEIGGKIYEGKNHAEAILKAKEDGQDISKIDRQAEGKFKLSDGTIIDRSEAKQRFGADRSEQLIPQDEAAKKADKDFENLKSETKPTVSSIEDEKNVDEIKVGEVLNKPITYNGERATLYQDGQTVVAKIEGKNKEYEIGNIDEVKEHPISDYGIEHETSVVGVDDNGGIKVRDESYKNNYSDPLAAINHDKDGNVVSVNLETADGKKRTFRGNIAEDIAYQIHLKEINKNNETRNEFEQFINTDEPTSKEINDATVSENTKKNTTENNAEVQRTKATKKSVKSEKQTKAQELNKQAVEGSNTSNEPISPSKGSEAEKRVSETIKGKEIDIKSNQEIFESLDKSENKKSQEGIKKAKSKVEEKFGEVGKQARFIHDNFDEILKQLNIERKC